MKSSKKTFARSLSIAAAAMLAVFSLSANAQSVNVDFPVDPEETMTLANGDTVEIYKGTVLTARGNRLTVRFPGGARQTYQVPEDYRFEIDGRKVRTRDLDRGDELTAYVTHSDGTHMIHHIEDGEVMSSVQPEPVADPEPMSDTLPSTASAQPLLALLGVASLGLAFLFFGVRRRVGSRI